MRLFVFGMGYSARAVVARMRPRLEAAWGTTRDRDNLADLAAAGVTPLLFDSAAPEGRPASVPRGGPAEQLAEKPAGEAHCLPDSSHSTLPRGGEELSAALAEADHILVSVAPDENGDPVLARYRHKLSALKPKALVYLSTVGVYGDHEGAWVDEASQCRPVSKRSRQRLAAEAAWRAFAEETGVPVAIVRLAGIYGPGRGPFEKVRRGTAQRIVKPGQVFNRIHVDDIAAIIEAALLKRADGAFNGSDDEPAPPQDVITFAAELLGVALLPEVAFDRAELSPMARSFYGENKRVQNRKIKDELGVRLAYPTYREGLKAILRSERDALDASGKAVD